MTNQVSTNASNVEQLVDLSLSHVPATVEAQGPQETLYRVLLQKREKVAEISRVRFRSNCFANFCGFLNRPS